MQHTRLETTFKRLKTTFQKGSDSYAKCLDCQILYVFYVFFQKKPFNSFILCYTLLDYCREILFIIMR